MAHGQTEAAWMAALSGDWTTPTNWSSNPNFPNNNGPTTFNARVLVTGSSFGVNLDQAVTLQTFELGSTDATVTLNANSITCNADYIQSAGVLDGISLAGFVQVAGTTTLTGGAMLRLGDFRSNGALVFSNTAVFDICDTDIRHGGSNASWTGTGNIRMGQGGTLEFGAASVFAITSDATMNWDLTGTRPVLTNLGTIEKTAGAGVTDINGVTFTNTGTLRVATGTFRADQVGINAAGNRLTTGTWRVESGATLDLVGQTILINEARVELAGANTTFAALDSIQTNAAGATFKLEGGATFTTQGNFTNNGRLDVGAGSTFTVAPGSTLTNFAAGTFTGGEFNIHGTLIFDNADVTTIDGSLALDDPAAQILDQNNLDAFRNLDTINPAGALRVSDGRNLTLAGDLAHSGSLEVGRVGATNPSMVDVPGTLTQSGGVITVRNNGTLKCGTFLDQSAGTIKGNGTIDSAVLLDGETAPGESTGHLILLGETRFRPLSILSIELGGVNPGVVIDGYDWLDVRSNVLFEGGSAGRLNVLLSPGFVPVPGMFFDVLTFPTRLGEFADYDGLDLGGGLSLTPVWTPQSLRLIVVPAPGAWLMLAVAGCGLRRRRSA